MALWTPDRITTALWLDAADASTITESGGAVSQWADKSGNGRDLSQSIAGQRPSVQSGGLNSMDVVRFDGSDDSLIRDGFFTLGSVGCVAVIKYRTLGSQGVLSLSARWDGGNGKRFYFMADNNNFFFDVGGDPRTIITDTSNTGWNLFSQFAVGGTHYAGLNGADVGSEANTDTSSPERFGLGGLISSTGDAVSSLAACDIAELVFITSAADRQKIEGYLAHKWGLAASLPAEHPYKDAAPIIPSLFGTITDKDGNPAERRITVLDATGHCVATDTSDPVTGAYSIESPNDDPYTLVFDGEPDRNAQVFANVIPGEPPA